MKKSQKIYLVIDVGNSNIVAAACQRNKIISTWRFPTNKKSIQHWINSISLSKYLFEEIIISSVVPTVNGTLKRKLGKAFNGVPHLLTHKHFSDLSLKIKNPKRVGIDRLVNGLAAHRLYKGDLLIIDIGTATTFDVVTGKGEFLGGVIAPGPQTINLALFEKCVQLPQLPLKQPKKVVSKETKSAIQSGVFYGYLSLLQGMIQKIQSEFQTKFQIILTGGPAPLFARHLSKVKHNPQLTLQGLMMKAREV